MSPPLIVPQPNWKDDQLAIGKLLLPESTDQHLTVFCEPSPTCLLAESALIFSHLPPQQAYPIQLNYK
jgi:hypothetical protein